MCSSTSCAQQVEGIGHHLQNVPYTPLVGHFVNGNLHTIEIVVRMRLDLAALPSDVERRAISFLRDRVYDGSAQPSLTERLRTLTLTLKTYVRVIIAEETNRQKSRRRTCGVRTVLRRLRDGNGRMG